MPAKYIWQTDFSNSFSSVDMGFMMSHFDDFSTSYSFSSPHLNHLAAAEAWGRADALLSMMNGLLYVLHGPKFYPFTLTQCIDYVANREIRVEVESIPVMEPFPEDHRDLRYRENPPEYLSPHGKIFFVSRYDVHIRYLLLMLGRDGLTFPSLYKALDTMKNAGYKEHKLAALRENDPKEIKKVAQDINDFRFTANKYQGAGLDARHGLEDPVETKARALSIVEASDIMRPIVWKFIEKRVSDQFDNLWSSVQYVTGDPQPGPPLGRGGGS